MELTKFLKISGVKPDNEASIYSFLSIVSIIQEENVSRLNAIFAQNGFEFREVPCSFLKIYTADNKEQEDINNALAQINKLNLKDKFLGDIRFSHFSTAFVERLSNCLRNNIPIVNEDNTFVSALHSADSYNKYISQFNINNPDLTQYQDHDESSEFSNTTTYYLDIEDLDVKNEIINHLNYIRFEDIDSSLEFIITHIIANLDMAIKLDNKEYHRNGYIPIIERALKGLKLTADMQNLIDTKVYPIFKKLDESYGRTGVA